MAPATDPARGFIEDENARVGHQPARNEDLLLIAAGKIEHRLFEIGGAHPEARLLLLAKSRASTLLDEAGADMAVAESATSACSEMTSGCWQQPLSLRSSVKKAIPASIAMPGLRMAISLPSMAIVPDVAGLTPNKAPGGIAAPGAYESGEAENLALTKKIEGNVMKAPRQRPGCAPKA